MPLYDTVNDSVNTYLSSLEDKNNELFQLLENSKIASRNVDLTYEISDLSKQIGRIKNMYLDKTDFLIQVVSGSKNVDPLSATFESTSLENALEKSEKLFDNELYGVPIDIQYGAFIVVPKTVNSTTSIHIPLSSQDISDYVKSIRND